MKLHDLEAFLASKQKGKEETDESDFLLDPDAKFKIILDDKIIPTLEKIDNMLSRELIINSSTVYTQKNLTNLVIFDKIAQAIDSEEGYLDDLNEEKLIEYEKLGSFPEGAFFLKDYKHLAIHVNKDGLIEQVDMMVPRDDLEKNSSDPLNKEFKKLMIREFKEFNWSDIASLFMKKD
ncbi:MAG: hypothetical protein ACTSVI_00405 [Promethearchaeota archaeon]